MLISAYLAQFTTTTKVGFSQSCKDMNPAVTAPGVELSKGFLGRKVSPNGGPHSSTIRSGSAKGFTTPRKHPSISCSDARGRRMRPAAVAVNKETKLGKVDQEVQNGSANGAAAKGAATGAARIRDTILQEPKNVSVYDYSHPPGPPSVHNYMEQVWPVTLISPFI